MRKKHNPAAIAGWCIILAFCLIAIFADFIAPYDPSELGTAYLKPSAEHLLGLSLVLVPVLSAVPVLPPMR